MDNVVYALTHSAGDMVVWFRVAVEAFLPACHFQLAYTRPEEYNGLKVPKVLLSGHHGEIAKWRMEQSEILTSKARSE